MRYTMDDLIKVYAEFMEISADEAKQQYTAGKISKYHLLQAYLNNEGIYGYASSLWSIFEALATNN